MPFKMKQGGSAQALLERAKGLRTKLTAAAHKFDQALHPRGSGGKFQETGAEARHASESARRKADKEAKQDYTPARPRQAQVTPVRHPQTSSAQPKTTRPTAAKQPEQGPPPAVQKAMAGVYAPTEQTPWNGPDPTGGQQVKPADAYRPYASSVETKAQTRQSEKAPVGPSWKQNETRNERIDRLIQRADRMRDERAKTHGWDARTELAWQRGAVLDRLRSTKANKTAQVARAEHAEAVAGFERDTLARLRGMVEQAKAKRAPTLKKAAPKISAYKPFPMAAKPAPVNTAASVTPADLGGKTEYIGRMSLAELHVDPTRFQYKQHLTDLQTGTTEALKDVRKWNEDLAGVISVWKDPANGKVYVVNGHHRHALASRLGVQTIPVREIFAADHVEARGKGALQNISEGKGTTLDAAKYLRDSGMTPADLKEQGVSLREKQIHTAAGAATVTERVWEPTYTERLSIEHAGEIGHAQLSPASQHAIAKDLIERSESGKGISKEYVREAIDEEKTAPSVSGGGMNMFGDAAEDRKLTGTSRELRAKIAESLGRDKRVFGSAKRNADRLEEAGNQIDRAASGQMAAESGTMLDFYHQYKHTSLLKGAIDAAAIAHHEAPTRSAKAKVAEDLDTEIRRRIREHLAA